MNRIASTPLAAVVVLAFALAGCPGGTTPAPADMARTPAPADMITPPPPADLAMTPADLAMTPPADLAMAPPADLAFRCASPADCRLFSSYCNSQACMCLPLPAKAPDPVCNDGMVTCLMDPCAGKQARCNAVTGVCEVQ